jgi:hypothetical protein
VSKHPDSNGRALLQPACALFPSTGGSLSGALLFLLAGCAHQGHGQPPRPGYGRTPAQAIEVCLPPGEHAFLMRLRCRGGAQAREVSREAAGTRTPLRSADDRRALEQLDPGLPLSRGEPDLHLVEALLVSCPEGDQTLFVDMYHCAQPPPEQAPDGMQLSR